MLATPPHSRIHGQPCSTKTAGRCGGAAAPRAAAPPPSQQEGLRELLAEKDQSIQELRETVDILEIKISKLEQLVRLKDSKIATLQAKLQAE